jgi:hypothetical protein
VKNTPRAARPDAAPPTPATPAGALPPYLVGPIDHAGSIEGSVVLGAAIPAQRGKCPIAALDAGAGLAGAVVYVDGVRAGRRPPDDNPTIDFAFTPCGIVPRAAALARADGTIAIRNDDVVRHVAGIAELGLVVPMPLEGQRFVVPVKPDAGWIHISEGASVANAFVPATPYVATTDTDGKFTIADVPPGSFPVRASWADAAGNLREAIATATVVAGQPASVTLTIQP